MALLKIAALALLLALGVRQASAAAPAVPVSPDGTSVNASSPAALTDTFGTIIAPGGANWAVTGGRITVNGVVDPVTGNVTKLLLCKGVIYQQATAAHLWWMWNGTPPKWSSVATDPTPTCPLVVPAPTPAPGIKVQALVSVTCPVSLTALLAAINSNLSCTVQITGLTLTSQ